MTIRLLALTLVGKSVINEMLGPRKRDDVRSTIFVAVLDPTSRETVNRYFQFGNKSVPCKVRAEA
jgi:hypothetical protein